MPVMVNTNWLAIAMEIIVQSLILHLQYRLVVYAPNSVQLRPVRQAENSVAPQTVIDFVVTLRADEYLWPLGAALRALGNVMVVSLKAMPADRDVPIRIRGFGTALDGAEGSACSAGDGQRLTTFLSSTLSHRSQWRWRKASHASPPPAYSAAACLIVSHRPQR